MTNGSVRRPRCRISLVTEVTAREDLWSRAHEIAATIANKPPTATQGTVKAIWESLDKPYRAAMDRGLIYTRLGNPIAKQELAAQQEQGSRRQRLTEDPLMTAHPLAAHIASVLAIDPDSGAIDFGGTWTSWGQLAGLSGRSPNSTRLDPEPTPRAGILLRNTPNTSRPSSACCSRAAPWW